MGTENREIIGYDQSGEDWWVGGRAKILSIDSYAKLLASAPVPFNVVPHPNPDDEEGVKAWTSKLISAWDSEDEDNDDELIDVTIVEDAVHACGDKQLVLASYAAFFPLHPEEVLPVGC